MTFWFLSGAMLVGFLALKNLPPDGVLEARASAGEASPFISILRPEGRVTLAKDGETRYVVTADPTYFQLTMPRFFHRATVTVEFRNELHFDIALGPSQSLTNWGFALQPLDTKAHPAEDIGDGWRRAQATFDASEMALANGEVQMALSVPRLGKSPGVVGVRSIAVRYERPALSAGDILAAIRRKLHL